MNSSLSFSFCCCRHRYELCLAESVENLLQTFLSSTLIMMKVLESSPLFHMSIFIICKRLCDARCVFFPAAQNIFFEKWKTNKTLEKQQKKKFNFLHKKKIFCGKLLAVVSLFCSSAVVCFCLLAVVCGAKRCDGWIMEWKKYTRRIPPRSLSPSPSSAHFSHSVKSYWVWELGKMLEKKRKVKRENGKVICENEKFFLTLHPFIFTVIYCFVWALKSRCCSISSQAYTV